MLLSPVLPWFFISFQCTFWPTQFPRCFNTYTLLFPKWYLIIPNNYFNISYLFSLTRKPKICPDHFFLPSNFLRFFIWNNLLTLIYPITQKKAQQWSSTEVLSTYPVFLYFLLLPTSPRHQGICKNSGILNRAFSNTISKSLQSAIDSVH